MLNKYAVFSVVMVVGLFNIGIYVLFIQPAGFAPQMTSLVPLDSIAVVVAPINASTLGRPLLPDLLAQQNNKQDKQQQHPMHVKFLDRTLMQSATFGENVSDSAAAARNASSATIAEDNSNKPQHCLSGECDNNSSSSSSSTAGPVPKAHPKTLSPLPPPPTSTVVGHPKKSGGGGKGKSKTRGITVPLSTVVPPPQPRTDGHNYSYLINQADVCLARTKADEQQLLLVFVCAAPGNFARRAAIRDTWGSVARNRSLGVRLVFLLGATPNRTAQALIVREASAFADIVQEDFADTYNNLTIKSVMLLKWVQRHCARAKFVLKTDDDSFINLRNLIKYVGYVKKRKRMLFGRLVRGARPVRSRTSKWFAPIGTFRERVYPDYLSGSAYAMSADVAHALYNVSLHTPLFHLEDVFVTGICARKTGVPRRHHSGFTYDRRPATGCAFRNAISGHRVSPEDMRKIWDELLHRNLTTCR